VLLSSLEPNRISGTHFFNLAAFLLNPPRAGDDYDGLAKRMRVPGSSSARFEGDESSGAAARVYGFEKHVHSNSAGEILGWTFR
jgi:hypothetical protein